MAVLRQMQALGVLRLQERVMSSYLCETWIYPPAWHAEVQDPCLKEGLIPPFLLIPLLAAQTVLGSALPLLPGLILEPSGWAAGWLCR